VKNFTGTPPFEQAIRSLNQSWAAATQAAHPQLFPTTGLKQTPTTLFLGCCDSRVPESTIMGLLPGEVFVHRNIGNIINPQDASWAAALHYAVEEVHVKQDLSHARYFTDVCRSPTS
jgi:carbonic anhydrase